MEPNDLIKNLYINPIPDESKVIEIYLIFRNINMQKI